MKKHILLCSVLAGGATMMAPSSFAGNFKPAPIHNNSQIVYISATDAQMNSAKAFVNKVAEQGIGFLSNKGLSKDQQISEFKTLLKNNFDMRTIARFALGRYWKSASAAQQKEYMSLFEKMVLNVYAKRFEEYQGQTVSILDARPEGKKDILVHSSVEQPSGPAIKVDWRIRNKDGSNKIVDIIVEGVSMSLTQRSDFSSVIQRGGGNIEVLLEHLRKQ